MIEVINGKEEEFLVDKYNVSISNPNTNSLGNKYDYSQTFVNGKLIEETTTNLSSLNLMEVDTSKIPENY